MRAKPVLVLVHLQDLSATDKAHGDPIAEVVGAWSGPVVSVDRTLFQEPIQPRNPAALSAWQKASTRLRASGSATELAAAAKQLRRLFPDAEFTVTGCYADARRRNHGCVNYLALQLKTKPHKSRVLFPTTRKAAKG